MILPEIAAAGIYNSQLAVKNTAVSKDREATKFEIELPMENGGISYIDGNPMPITPNTLICAKPGQKRHTKFPYKCYFLHIVLQSGVLYDTLLRIPDFLRTNQPEAYQTIFSKLVRCFQAPSDNAILLQSLVLELIDTMDREAKSRRRSTGNAVFIESACSYIHTHLTEDLSLNNVANAVAISPIHFHNSFKAATGKTLREYVEEKRINKAIHLLMTTDHTLTEIAFDCGFSSQSYFSYVFKRRIGKTPREYIQEINSRYAI